MKRLLVLALLLASLTLVVNQPSAGAAPPTAPPGFSVTTYNNLGMQPYGLTNFITLPGDGHTLLALAKYGDIHRLTISTDGQTMQSVVIGHVPVYYQGDRGLLGISLAPDYLTSGTIYLLYDYTGANGPTGRLESWRVTNPLAPTAITEGSVLLDDLPSWSPPANVNPALCADSHTIGTVVTAPDGTLFVGNGDGSGYCTPAGQVDTTSLQAQDFTSPRGKIFHINPDGTGVTTNPQYDAANPTSWQSRVYLRGFRNPFRFNLVPGTNDQLWIGDVGWNHTEELDRTLVPPIDRLDTTNFGWPCLEGNHPPPEFVAANNADWNNACMGFDGAHAMSPVYTWDHVSGEPGSAAVGGDVYTGAEYPAPYQGAEFFGDYGRGLLFSRDVNGNVTTFGDNNWGAITSIHTGLEGDIFVGDISSNNDQSDQTSRIMRIHFNAGQPTNQLPVASAQATPQKGNSPLTVNFTANGSHDPDGTIVSYTWNFGDGFVPVGGPSATHTYATPGHFNATLTVTDNQGGVGLATVAVDTTNAPPLLSVQKPPPGELFHIGDTVHVTATATDPDGPPPVITYQGVLHHCPTDPTQCHTHPGAVQSSPDFVIPDHGVNFYLEVLVIATDNDGAFVTAAVDFPVANPDNSPPPSPTTPPPEPPPADVGQPGHATSTELYHPISPFRVLDTRDSGTKVQAGQPLVFALPGQDTAALNVTATEPEGTGFLRVYPCDQPAPQNSTVNYNAGQNASNLTFVKTGAAGNICVLSQYTTHVVIDEMGFFVKGDQGLRFTPAQQRLFDTRPNFIAAMQQLVFNNASTPAGTQAMLANLTVTDPVAPGFLRAYPCGSEDGTSNVNYDTGQTVANLTVADVVGGTTCFRSFAKTNLVTDLTGYFGTNGAPLRSFAPQRLFDTRSTPGFSRLQGGVESKINFGSFPSEATSLVLNITAVDPSADGYVSVYPCGADPGTSVVNYVAHQTAVANMTVVQIPPSHLVCIRSFADTDLVVDISGWFTS